MFLEISLRSESSPETDEEIVFPLPILTGGSEFKVLLTFEIKFEQFSIE